ncbi:MAG: hypothetical protein ACYDBQ_10245 [Thermoplasmatota archaeon]
MAEQAYAYLGHFARSPSQMALVTADSFQGALDACDAVGSPDEGSFEVLRDPMVLRLQARIMKTGDDELVELDAHPSGALAWAGRDLVRMSKRVAGNAHTVTGDLIRSYGPECNTCGYFHFERQGCKAFLEPSDRLATYLGILDGDPRQVVVVAAADEGAARDVARAAGPRPEILFPIPTDFVFSFLLSRGGATRSDPTGACHCESPDDLGPLLARLRVAASR